MAAPEHDDATRVRLLVRLLARLTRAAVSCGLYDEADGTSAEALRRADVSGDLDLTTAALGGRLVGLGVGAQVAAALGLTEEVVLLRERLLPYRRRYVVGGAGATNFLGPAQRVRTADLLETFSSEEWDHRSLCDGWTVRDVAAHLTMQQLGHNLGVTQLETLVDIVVHGQDIAVPLRRDLAVPVGTAATAATRVWSYRTTRRDRKKARVFRSLPYERYRFAVTDTSWSVGHGPDIHGPILAILLVLTGRPAGLPYLAGEGAAALAEQLDLAQS